MGAEDISAVVTVADDGGSSGRIRRELGQIPPGDLRMAIAALADNSPHGSLWEEVLQHRFGGHGALAGHAVGNLLISGLIEVTGDPVASLAEVARLAHSRGTILPVVPEPLDIEADVAGLDADPRVVRQVRGQVAVASTPGQVRRVRLLPERPSATPEVIQAIGGAELVTLGPGSWFTSVIPHLLVPEVVAAISATQALRVVVLNLTAEPGETQGFSAERHIHMLSQHAPDVRVDVVLVDSSALLSESEKTHLWRAAQRIGADIEYRPLRHTDAAGRATDLHDPQKLAQALSGLYAARS